MKWLVTLRKTPDNVCCQWGKTGSYKQILEFWKRYLWNLYSFPVKFLLISLIVTLKSESCSVVSDSLWPHGLCSAWNSPGQNTRVGCCSLLQGIFPTQVSCIVGRFFTSQATREADTNITWFHLKMYISIWHIYITQWTNISLMTVMWHHKWIGMQTKDKINQWIVT